MKPGGLGTVFRSLARARRGTTTGHQRTSARSTSACHERFREQIPSGRRFVVPRYYAHNFSGPRSRRGKIMRECGSRRPRRAVCVLPGFGRGESILYALQCIGYTCTAALITRCMRDTPVTTYTGHYSRSRSRSRAVEVRNGERRRDYSRNI